MIINRLPVKSETAFVKHNQKRSFDQRYTEHAVAAGSPGNGLGVQDSGFRVQSLGV